MLCLGNSVFRKKGEALLKRLALYYGCTIEITGQLETPEGYLLESSTGRDLLQHITKSNILQATAASDVNTATVTPSTNPQKSQPPQKPVTNGSGEQTFETSKGRKVKLSGKADKQQAAKVEASKTESQFKFSEDLTSVGSVNGTTLKVRQTIQRTYSSPRVCCRYHC
jgi:hypothetical protein